MIMRFMSSWQETLSMLNFFVGATWFARPTPSLSRLQIPSALSLSLLLGLGGCAKTDDAVDERETMAPRVAFIEAKRQELVLTQQLPGRVIAQREAEVRPQVSGIIEQRFFTEGADVHAGELLYQINRDSYLVAVAQATAQVAQVRALLVNREVEAKRYGQLLQGQTVSRRDADLAQANYVQAQAELAVAQAQLDQAQLNLARTQIRAPIAGRIGRSRISEGALVAADQEQPLALIQQFDPVYVDMVQSSEQLLDYRQRLTTGELKPGSASVSLLLPGKRHYSHPGTLILTEINVDPATAVVTRRAQFPNPGGLLLPGLFVQVQLEVGVAPQAILVPQQAVHYSARGEAQVWVLDDSDVASLRSVRLLRSEGDQWALAEGVECGERLVVEGSLKLYPGLKVTAEPWGLATSVVLSSANATSSLFSTVVGDGEPVSTLTPGAREVAQ